MFKKPSIARTKKVTETKKKLDVFNFFYSFAAVIILIGVIAKLLEWPSQDILITLGLGIEALVFGISAVKFSEVKVDKNELNNKLSDKNEILDNNEIVVNNGTEYSSNTVKDLERFLKISKTLFFDDSLIKYNESQYQDLSKILLKIFKIKLADRKSLKFLETFPIKLTIPNLETFRLENEISMVKEEIILLIDALESSSLKGIMKNFVFYTLNNKYYINNKLDKIQIYGKLNKSIIQHCNKYNSNIIPSPEFEIFKKHSDFDEEYIIRYLIDNINISNHNEFNSLIELIKDKSDEIKLILFRKFTPFKFYFTNKKSYQFLSNIVSLSLMFNDKDLILNEFKEKISFIDKFKIEFKINETINYKDENIKFGSKNEFVIKINEIFSKAEIFRIESLEKITGLLINNKIGASKDIIFLFDIENYDSKDSLFRKLNKSISKNGNNPEGPQLLFLLLYKQFSLKIS